MILLQNSHEKQQTFNLNILNIHTDTPTQHILADLETKQISIPNSTKKMVQNRWLTFPGGLIQLL